MRKRIFSIFLAIAMIFCFVPLSAYADEHQHTFENKHGYDLSNLPDGYSIPCKIYESPCSSECGYSLYSWDVFGLSGQFVDKSGTAGIVVYQHYREWFEKIYGKNASAKQYETGGGSAGTGGVGRHPSGYTDTAGTPSISSAGVYTLTLDPIIEVLDKEHCTVTVTGNKVRIEDFDEDYIKSTTVYPIRVYYTATSPADGKFSVPYKPSQKVYDYYYGGSINSSGNSINGTSNGSLYAILLKNGVDFSGGYTKLDFYGRASVFQGTQVWFAPVFSSSALPNGKFFSIGKSNVSYAYYHMTFYPLVVQFTPDQVSKKTNITINQNVWNGNIYQDNSTNLTYIYPQYTTINENSETVTNISENPIIYNNKTKQYYTYDSVTNNYYYITYESTTPTPSPDPGTDPTPTPTPGGDTGNTGDTTGILAALVEIKDNMIQGFADLKATLVQGWADLSANFTLAIENLTINIQNFFHKTLGGSTVDPNIPGGGSSTSTPETGDKDDSDSSSSGWSWNPLKWLADLLKDVVEKILKGLWKILTSIFGFILWLLSLMFQLFPWMPGSGILALCAGVIVVTIVRIIKFIIGR